MARRPANRSREINGTPWHAAKETPSEARETDRRAAEAAAQLMLEDGIAGVRMTDIADTAKVGVATLYRHFSTKVSLAVAAGTLMWAHLNQRIHQVVESDGFLELDGAHRLQRLLNAYAALYLENPSFVRFLDEFDHLVRQEGDSVGQEALAAYGQQVDSFYVMFEDAYLLGRSDGSVVREVDFRTFYLTVAHALMGVAEKLVAGEVIPSDDFGGGELGAELGCLVDMSVRYLRG